MFLCQKMFGTTSRAGNLCSYNHKGEVCGKELIISDNGKSTITGVECHIVGEKPLAARHTENFPEMDSYSNRILMCGIHHTIIDADPETYSVEVLHNMKKAHEEIVVERIKKKEIQPIVIKDSTFKTEVKDAEEAIGMEVNRPAYLSGVKSELKVTGNVKKAVGFSTNQGLCAISMSCSNCGKNFPFACTGPPPASTLCPHCGKENVIHR